MAAPTKFWGKWGALNPNNAKKFIEMQFNRGYSQPIATGSYTSWGDPSRSRIAYYAARWDMDFLKIVAMRVDAARTPLIVLRRQIWIARMEYWGRKATNYYNLRRAAKIEWAYIKTRVNQPFTWKGRDVLHFIFWALNVAMGFCVGEVIGRETLLGYDVVDPSWQPTRPMFAPGFYHVHGAYDDTYPFEKHSSNISRTFSRGYWPNTDNIYFCPNTIPLHIPHPSG